MCLHLRATLKKKGAEKWTLCCIAAFFSYKHQGSSERLFFVFFYAKISCLAQANLLLNAK